MGAVCAGEFVWGAMDMPAIWSTKLLTCCWRVLNIFACMSAWDKLLRMSSVTWSMLWSASLAALSCDICADRSDICFCRARIICLSLLSRRPRGASRVANGGGGGVVQSPVAMAGSMVEGGSMAVGTVEGGKGSVGASATDWLLVVGPVEAS